jgi:triacylglycerol lipase
MSSHLVAAAALAAVLLLAAGVAWAWWRRRGRAPRRRRWSRARAPRPVVLVHGLFGFDELVLGKTRHAYFKGVGPRLEQAGRKVHHLRLPAAGSIEVRAQALAAGVQGLPGGRFIALAHSMGGVDARWAISQLGLAKRVTALVTVGAPHRGTPVADLGADLASKLGVTRALALAGVGLEALDDLTSARMARFNEKVLDVRSVTYASVVGSVHRKRRANPLLLPTHLWLSERDGANDGVVPSASQRWGEVLAEIDADHWAQIGWSRHFDAGTFYADLLRDLEAAGL